MGFTRKKGGSKDTQTSENVNSEASGSNSERREKLKEIVETSTQSHQNWVATVLIQSIKKYPNDTRMDTLAEVVDAAVRKVGGDGVVVLPGGWFSAGEQEARCLYDWVEADIQDTLAKYDTEIVVCVGVDGRVTDCQRDQIALAVSKKGIIAVGRKFYAAPAESGRVDLAQSHLSNEDGKPRIFSLNAKSVFLCACYDSFGVKKKKIHNPDVNVIVDLVHGFNPNGEGGSGEVYFAKYGFAAASKAWNCPVFGAAVFFRREIPRAWPTGVLWNQGTKSAQRWCYADNPMKPTADFDLSIIEGKALVRVYKLE